MSESDRVVIGEIFRANLLRKLSSPVKVSEIQGEIVFLVWNSQCQRLMVKDDPFMKEVEGSPAKHLPFEHF